MLLSSPSLYILACWIGVVFSKPIDGAASAIISPGYAPTANYSETFTIANSSHTIPTTQSIQNYAALGDSYASGVDAGAPIGPCFRHNDSYPAQLNRTARLGSDHEFQFAACGGTFLNGMAVQINSISKPDLATISIGGNDAGFFKTLDACVYKFYSSFSSTCYDRLDEATEFINSEYFENTYGQIMDDLLKKNDATSYIVFATGYSPFFDRHMTDDCNDQSLSYWPFYQAKLTVEVRTRLNGVIDRLNERMSQIIKDLQDERIMFVNWAPRVAQHLFCQPGKPPYDGENTWFFNIGRGDSLLATGKVFHPKSQGYSAVVDEILSVWGVAPTVK